MSSPLVAALIARSSSLISKPDYHVDLLAPEDILARPVNATPPKTPVITTVRQTTASVNNKEEFTSDELQFFAQGENLTYSAYVAAVAQNNEITTIASLPEIGDEFLNSVNARRKKEGQKPLFDMSGFFSKITFANVAAAAVIAVFSLVTSISSAAHNYVDEQINGKHFTTTHIQDTTTIEFVEGIERARANQKQLESSVINLANLEREN
ncbi:MAG: hypothetical protein ACP5N9_04140 [Candidatus Bilamarchaeum sp.]|jgi:stalled ribosome rescue protein Dom34